MASRLNGTDAWLLGAITETRRGAKPMQLWELVNNADWLNRSIPSFSEARTSLPRLVASGYLVMARDAQGRLTLKATDAAFDLRDRVRADTLGGVLSEVATLVRREPDIPADDVSNLGASAVLTQAEWDAAVTKNSDWMERQIRRFLPGFRSPGSTSGGRQN